MAERTHCDGCSVYHAECPSCRIIALQAQLASKEKLLEEANEVIRLRDIANAELISEFRKENAALTKEIKGHLEDLAKTVDERDEAVKDRDYHKMRGEEGVRLLTASNLEALDRAEAVEKERDELKFECRRWERIINRASESSEARIILAEAAVFVAFNKEKALEG